MSIHKALPQKLTVESLATWITENKVDQKTHIDEIPLTEEQKHEFEEKIALATSKLYELADLKKIISDTIKLGTPYVGDQHQPVDYQVPPTKGTKELEANRMYYSQILNQGYFPNPTEIYGVPYAAKRTVVYFDIEGVEYPNYTTPFTKEQSDKFVGMFDN